MHALLHPHPSDLHAGLALLCEDMHQVGAPARAVHKLQTTATGNHAVALRTVSSPSKSPIVGCSKWRTCSEWFSVLPTHICV